MDQDIMLTLIEHNDQWDRKNAVLLDEAEIYLQSNDTWAAYVTLGRYDASELRRLQLWRATLEAYPELEGMLTYRRWQNARVDFIATLERRIAEKAYHA